MSNDEWRCAVDTLTEMERARYDEPETHSDLITVGGTRL